MSQLAESLCFVAKNGKAGQGIRLQLLCQLPGLLQTHQRDIGWLVVGSIFAGGFAESGTTGFGIEYIVDHLESQANALGKMIQFG